MNKYKINMGRLKNYYMDLITPNHDDLRQVELKTNEYMYALKEDLEKTNLIFVYGTLMQGYNNHSFIQDGKFISKAQTCELYQMTAEGIPFVDKNIATSQIQGELYQINDIVELHNLDCLEGHPDFYCREIVSVEDSQGKEHKAWIYFCSRPNANVIASGDYKDYR
jgi:gamma-glutamylcyclotransferase (GGCT)/AIG2-like uncharacterized protein YtfP